MNGKLPVFNIERFAIHDGPGIRTTIFLQGCTLRCQWCANPESQSIGRQLMFSEQKCVGCGTCAQSCPHSAVVLKDGKAVIHRDQCEGCGTCESVCLTGAMKISGKWMDAEELFHIVQRDADYYRQTGGGLTLSGGEALLHISALLPLLEQCRDAEIPVAFETCGQVPKAYLKEALPYTILFLYDLKTLDAATLKQYTGGDLSVILENFRLIAEHDPGKLVIRVPVIPGVNDSEAAIRRIFELATSHHVRQVDLLPYHTLGVVKYRQLGIPYPFDHLTAMRKEVIEPVCEIGRAYGLSVTVGG